MLLGRYLHRGLMRNLLKSNQCSIRHHNFDGETYSKTSLNLLTKEDDGHTYIEAYSHMGFRLTSGLRILGPCAVFPKTVLHWNMASSERITPESLTLFSMLDPKPDVLIIGIGSRGAKYDKSIIKFLRNKKINVEILPTEQACSTFNFLNLERRVVAAALIPPIEVDDLGEDFVIDNIEEIQTLKEKDVELEESSMAGVTKRMETFRDKGFAHVVMEGDRQRKKKLLDEKKKEEGEDRPEDKEKGLR